MTSADSEQRVRSQLEKEFAQSFAEIQLDFGYLLDRSSAHKRFDAVSKDRKIIGMVKDYSAVNKVGYRTRLARVSQDFLHPHLVEATRKFLYLSSDFRDWLEKTYDAAVPQDVEIRTIPKE